MAALEMQSGTVLILITLAVLPIAAISFARSGNAWRRLGKGRLAIDEPPPPRPDGAGRVDRAVQEAEARQMIEAKDYRRRRRGEPPLDVEAEVRRLLEGDPAPQEAADDAELREEVRRLVIARNERRARRGEPLLDVDAETERQLADLVGSGS